MRIAVVGPGALGLLMAARLSQAGEDVLVLDYKPERADLLAGEGLLIEDADGETRVRVAASADPADLAGVELALVAVKAYGTAGAAQVLAEHLPPGARAATMQNGAGNLETLAAALGPERVLGGITSEGATLLGPGRVRHAGRGQTHLGPVQGQPDDFTVQVVEAFKRAGFEAAAAEGAQDLIWSKLVINVGINALTALLEVPNGMLLELEGAARTMQRAVDEAVAVGLASGVRFLHQDMLEATRQVAGRTAANISSMLQDVRARRRTEVAFINGHVAAQAERLGLAAPVNAALTDLVSAKQQNYLRG